MINDTDIKIYLDAILADNWSQYDEIKLRHNQDVMYIDSSQRWELNFIEDLLYKHLPNQDRNMIAIKVYLYFKASHAEVQRSVFIRNMITRIMAEN